MEVIKSRTELIKTRQEIKDKLGFVPTMGALHAGHLSLGKLAREHADKVIYSIFVNPTQFAQGEDLDKYPRDIEGDLHKLEGLADYVYLPNLQDIYPNGSKVNRKAGAAAQGLESLSRPHFFDGVVTVVGILFEQIRPDIAVFGEKDFQQLMALKETFSPPNRGGKGGVQIISAPIMREPDGLAMSSRNAYLSAEERQIAPKLYEILSSNLSIAEMKDELIKHSFRIDYVETRWNRLFAAVWLGSTRLIDNVEIGA
ncbi:MAG: pantoate--beta-alanine ligase [Alphaproteobacteria bacterium CG11_big_fil_rev_8_21_14_0_20_44_7]|nr:MAG: pantoate--beta-alanine ligase [Alphaproteobacteria bacterium CG11_big_fil_rev_8_21_14_0_20_44_7]